MATLIEKKLWRGLDQLEPASRLGGIYADKPGYHNTRDRLKARRLWRDYSIRLPRDRRGPGDEAAAIDWTFPDAQDGRYATIAKYSKRLLDAGRLRDPRTYAMREFYGNTDWDHSVEGWDFVRSRAASSDRSHLWHIHISVRRAFVNDERAIEAVLSILRAESLTTWQQRWGGRPRPRPTTHRVAAGETLGAIARRYKTTVNTLCRLNAITDPDHIRQGQVLKLA
ncbi:LysM domain-containing protein [Actinoplanes sp. NPDC051346]|uniref:LysM peptidoglycan-binding domain-containing protein n=1 Tax=Actinoplanes sp. NPDC051346 TaxID=3155048 RepID=UPI00341CEE94